VPRYKYNLQQQVLNADINSNIPSDRQTKNCVKYNHP
jgi:hypothetical protein